MISIIQEITGTGDISTQIVISIWATKITRIIFKITERMHTVFQTNMQNVWDGQLQKLNTVWTRGSTNNSELNVGLI